MEINYATIIGLVLALTQWVKERLGLKGRPAEIVSFLIGLVSGGGYQYVTHPPALPADWFGLVVVGLITALVPSGLYKLVTGLIDRAKANQPPPVVH